MGMLVNIILLSAVLGYAGYLVVKLVRSLRAGKGNPYGCSGDCSRCSGGCSRCSGGCHSANSKP